MYEKLGLDLDVQPTMKFPQPPGNFIENFNYRQPWTLEKYPMLADWVSEMDVPLDAAAAAIRKPIFYAPWLQSPEEIHSNWSQNLIELRLPHVQLFRKIARNFAARAMYRVGQGNIDGAIDDKLTLHLLGRRIAPNTTVVQYIVGVAIEGMAMAVPLANPEHPLTEAQICRILDGLNALPQRASTFDAREWERYAGLSYMQHTVFGQRNTVFGELAGLCNQNIVYHRWNEMYDAMQEPPPRTKYDSILKAADTTLNPAWKRMALLLTPGGLDTVIAHLLIATLTPAIQVFEEIVLRVECSDNLQRLVLAILLYRLEHGKMPDENWAVQIEKYLGENPEHYFSCPMNPSPKGKTTYALVQYGNDVREGHDTILLVERVVPVSFDKATITVDGVLELIANPRQPHSSGMNSARLSGAVVFLKGDRVARKSDDTDL